MYQDVILQITLFEVCPDPTLYKSPVYISCIHLLHLLDAGLIDTS